MKLRSVACCLSVVLAGLCVAAWARSSVAKTRATQSSDDDAAISREQTGPYYALLIGVNDYQHLPKLKTAVNDAQGMSEILHTQYGFETTILRNPSREQITHALNSFRRELDRNANLLIYYAGHGFYDKEADKAYWLPADAEPGDTTHWIIADEITTDAKVMPARHVLIVSDSCYSGGIGRGMSGEFTPTEHSRYLEKMLEGKSRTLMASGGLEPVSDGGAHGHSVFAAALIGALENEDDHAFSAQIFFERFVRISVAGRSDQTPEYTVIRNSGHDAGDFVFLRSADAPRAEVAENTAPEPKTSARRSPSRSGTSEPPAKSAQPKPAAVAERSPEPDAAADSKPAAEPAPQPQAQPSISRPVAEPVSLPTATGAVSTATSSRPEFQAMKLSFNAGVSAMHIANQIEEETRGMRDDVEKTEFRQKRIASCQVAVARFLDAEQAAPHEDVANVMSVAASNHAIVWANLGTAYECLGRYEDAIVSFRRAAALRPQANYYAHLSEDTARAALATHDPEMIQKRTARANFNCERAADIDPSAGAACWKNLGTIYYKGLSIRQALPALRKSVEADPNDPEAWYELGSVLAAGITSVREGDHLYYTVPPGTRKAYQHCIALDPAGPFAKACKGGLAAVNSLAQNPAAARENEDE